MSENLAQSELDALSAGLTTLAVTGTNGKTSTTSMIASIVRAAGELDARVTTLGMWVGDEQIADDGSMSSFVRTVRRARELGAKTLALEVTSRALADGFAARWPAHIAVFTNLTHDHLDRHGTPEHYLAAKAQLFLKLRAGGTAVLNAADPSAALLAELLPAHSRAVGFVPVPGALPSTSAVSIDGLAPALRGGAMSIDGLAPALRGGAMSIELAVAALHCDEHGTDIVLAASPLANELGGALRLSVLGAFQVDNALGAALATACAGYTAGTIRRGLAEFAGVPGRLEAFCREPLVLVDFAHTPDGLERALKSARAIAQNRRGRLACVFGCGGDRDPDKRPRMGELADELCDVIWLTTDNPRNEAPAAIATMVRKGARGRATWHDIPERRAAIEAALNWADRADVVVVAGRGAERHQQFASGPMPFSDRDVVREYISGQTPK